MQIYINHVALNYNWSGIVSNLINTKISILQHSTGKQVLGTYPVLSPISFVFMQFWGTFWPNKRWVHFLWEILYPLLITSLCFFRNKLDVKLISSKPSLKSLVKNNGGWTRHNCDGNWFGWESDENQRQAHCYLKAAVYSEHKQTEIKAAPWTEYKISMRIKSLIKANPGFKLMCDIIKTHKNAFQWDAYRPLVDRIP